MKDTATMVSTTKPGEQSERYLLWRLTLVSFVALYLEIMVVRWIGTEVGVFAYVQNLALIACFLGFGLGCHWSKRRGGLEWSLRALMGLVVFVYLPVKAWQNFVARISNSLSLSPDALLWGYSRAPSVFRTSVWLSFLASTVILACFLLLMVLLMVPVGQWVGYYLDVVGDPIKGYTANLLGSVVGVWAFAVMAVLWLPPVCWLAIAILMFLIIHPPSPRGGAITVGLAVVIAAVVGFRYSRSLGIFWSPYQKIQVESLGDHQYTIFVNNHTYMSIANMTPEYLAGHPEIAEALHTESSYDVPFRFAFHRRRVLIVGAGAGNDAAAALRNGADKVDAVELDPLIYNLGQKLHPEHPYESPKVRMVLNDARAFLRDAHGKYDVILFGLLDSHTQFSGYSNMRVDNYVYTEESFREAARLLAPNGILVVKFEVHAPWTWMGQRFYELLDQLYHRAPVVFSLPPVGALMPATVYITSPDSSLWTRAAEGEVGRLVEAHRPHFKLTSADGPPVTTDDWPYIYIRNRTIPQTYLIVSLILLGVAFLLVRRTFHVGELSTWHFFLLGAGFMLLETQLISRLALYFGTTWLVTSIVLTAVLLMLVLANLYVSRFRPARFIAYYCLLVTMLAIDYLFPWNRLPFPAHTIGFLLCFAYAIPVFFAGIIFTESFRRALRKSEAFGANIFGAVAGGLAQNVSFILGIKMLLLLAILFYAGAAFFQRLVRTPSAKLADLSTKVGY